MMTKADRIAQRMAIIHDVCLRADELRADPRTPAEWREEPTGPPADSREQWVRDEADRLNYLHPDEHSQVLGEMMALALLELEDRAEDKRVNG